MQNDSFYIFDNYLGLRFTVQTFIVTLAAQKDWSWFNLRLGGGSNFHPVILFRENCLYFKTVNSPDISRYLLSLLSPKMQ